MRFQDYTPDAICKALNLKGFEDDAALDGSIESLRVLLAPSFDPEVCITISAGEGRPPLECRAFSSMFWHQATAADRPPMFIDNAFIDRGQFAEFASRLRTTSEEMKRQARNWAVLDGMRAHLVLRSGENIVAVEANVGASDLLSQYVGDLVSTAHGVLPQGHCRNALARAARYVDLDLSIEEPESPKPVSRILILREPESKKELIHRLTERPGNTQATP